MFTFKHLDIVFQCKLAKERCQGKTVDGYRCKRQTRKTIPYCWQHTTSICGVVILCSNIPNAGMGLYASRPFQTGDLIAPYIGELLTREQIDTRYGESDDSVAPYAWKIPDSPYIIDSACKRGIASYVNDPRDIHRVNCIINTIEPNIQHRSTVDSKRYRKLDPGPINALIAIKPICAGKEIFVSYGDEYWGVKHPVHKTVF